MQKYAFLDSLGMKKDMVERMVEQNWKRLEEALRHPGRGGTKWKDAWQQLMANMISEGAVPFEDRERVSKLLQTTINVLYSRERVPNIDYKMAAAEAIEMSHKTRARDASARRSSTARAARSCSTAHRSSSKSSSS